ncbi:MAG: hypothetical protein K5945_02685 [Bacteroidaceae bacterium]|nr:hypothetical protein [Bacteroidaceae bacterium]
MVWEQSVVIPVCALLFTLLVYLSATMADTGNRPVEVLGTALFLLIFFPGVENFFARDEEAMLELSSQCIVPFFITQYKRVSQRDYRHVYALMLLMGIFCSYTHDGITLPLCGSFLWIAFLNRDTFFKTACWPMVIGFLIGTVLSIWHHLNTGEGDMPDGLEGMLTRTGETLLLLWNTKVFLCSVALTSYLSIRRRGRRLLVKKFHEHTLLCCCAMLSFCVLPFAPLGIDNAVTGVCFFCMYWMLILAKSLIPNPFVGSEERKVISDK